MFLLKMGPCLTVEIRMDQLHNSVDGEDVHAPFNLPYIRPIRRKTRRSIIIPIVDIWKRETMRVERNNRHAKHTPE